MNSPKEQLSQAERLLFGAVQLLDLTEDQEDDVAMVFAILRDLKDNGEEKVF